MWMRFYINKITTNISLIIVVYIIITIIANVMHLLYATKARHCLIAIVVHIFHSQYYYTN